MGAMILTPLPIGVTAATEVRLFSSADRDGVPLTAAATVSNGYVEFTPPAAARGRYWPSILATLNGVETIVHVKAVQAGLLVDYIDLPDDDRLVVSPEVLARKANFPLPLSEDVRETLTDAILDAQSDVEAYLGRPVVPAEYVQPEAYGYPDGEWRLDQHGDETVLYVKSAVPILSPVSGQPTNYYVVTYVAGLDAKHDPALRPIRRYVTAHALNSPEVTRKWQAVVKVKGEVRSLSAEGQSVSFAPATLGGGGGKAGDGTPGALPTLASLDRWREAGRRIYQGPSRVGVWPYRVGGGL